MPIRAELRHFYRGPLWAERRWRALDRAAHRCEHCGAPNAARVLRLADGSWQYGPLDRLDAPVLIQLGVAHLDHDAENNADDNLAALCRRCHLIHDKGQHKETRSRRKDSARPILRAVGGC